jgi:hypothetical protein
MLRDATGAAGNGRPFSLTHVHIANVALAKVPLTL